MVLTKLPALPLSKNVQRISARNLAPYKVAWWHSHVSAVGWNSKITPLIPQVLYHVLPVGGFVPGVKLENYIYSPSDGSQSEGPAPTINQCSDVGGDAGI